MYPVKCLLWGLMAVLLLNGCGSGSSGADAYLTVEQLKNGCKQVVDGAGKRFLLVPRGTQPPMNAAKAHIIRTPVRRVACLPMVAVGVLAELGEIKTLVGVTRPHDEWVREDVRKGFAAGRISYLGMSPQIDYERLRQASPSVVFASGPWHAEKCRELDLACVVVHHPNKSGLQNRVQGAVLSFRVF